MGRAVMLIVLLVMMMPAVLAAQGYFAPNTNSTIFSNCIDEQTGSFVDSTQNVTIYYPNNTLFVNNTAMFNISLGRFSYTFITPNVSGEYSVVKECKRLSDDEIVVGGDTFNVKDVEEEAGLAQLAVLVGSLIAIVFTFSLAIFLLKQENVWMKLYGMITMMFSGLFINFSTYLAMVFSEGTVYYAPMKALFIILTITTSTLLLVGFIFLLAIFFIKPTKQVADKMGVKM